MKQRVFFLTRLRADADRDAYERFLREFDYPTTQRILPVSSYRATRLEGSIMGEGGPQWDYIEVIDVDDFDAYREAFANPSPEVQELIDGVFGHIDERQAIAVHGTVVE
jgi:hypothetical protein